MILVALLRYSHIGRASVALAIAEDIVLHPGNWHRERDRLVNPTLATVRFTPTPLLIDDYRNDLWKPNRLARRFVTAAIHWRLNRYPRRAFALA